MRAATKLLPMPLVMEAIEVFTITEAAVLLKCSKAHVGNLLAGKVPGVQPLPYVPIGRRKLIRRSALNTWMEKIETKC